MVAGVTGPSVISTTSFRSRSNGNETTRAGGGFGPSSLTRIGQQVGSSFGVAVGAVVLQSAVAGGHTLTQAFGQAFWWTTGFTVLAVLASLFLPGRRIPSPGPAVASGPPATAAAAPTPADHAA